jgi:RecB family endonuclease NucS
MVPRLSHVDVHKQVPIKLFNMFASITLKGGGRAELHERPKTSTKVLLLEKPDLQKAADCLRDSFRREDLVIIAGNCQCKYHGRASSSLDWGERVTLIKEDGSVQVHRPTGYEPVNWQPPRCTLDVSLDESLLRIRVHRPKPKEILEIFFNDLLFVASFRPMDKAEFNLYISEDQMRDALTSNPSILEEGLKLIDFERKVEPGFIDFYGRDAKGRVMVVELKRSAAGKDAVLQLKRYVDAVNEATGLDVRGVVAAPGLKSGAQGMMAVLGLEFKKLTPRTCAQFIKKKATKKISEFFEPI